MTNEERITQLEEKHNALLARTMASETMLSTLMAFIDFHPLLLETVLQQAADQATGATELDGIPPGLQKVFREQIAEWIDRSQVSSRIRSDLKQAGAKKGQS